MLLVFCVIIAISAHVCAQDEPFQVAIQQSLEEAALLTVQAETTWTPTTALMATVNSVFNSVVSNFTVIYNVSSVDAQIFINASYSNGDCPVLSTSDYITNQTLTLEYLCCHTQKLRSPGLLTTYMQMCNVYLGGCTGAPDPTSTLLDYIQQINKIARIGFSHASCLDDQTVVIPQAALVYGLSIVESLGIMLQTYQNLLLDIATLFTCVEGLSPRCLVNGTLTLSQAAPPDLDFNDVGFDLVCGYPVLSQFELSRFATPCQPVTTPFL